MVTLVSKKRVATVAAAAPHPAWLKSKSKPTPMWLIQPVYCIQPTVVRIAAAIAANAVVAAVVLDGRVPVGIVSAAAAAVPVAPEKSQAMDTTFRISIPEQEFHYSLTRVSLVTGWVRLSIESHSTQFHPSLTRVSLVACFPIVLENQRPTFEMLTNEVPRAFVAPTNSRPPKFSGKIPNPHSHSRCDACSSGGDVWSSTRRRFSTTLSTSCLQLANSLARSTLNAS